MGKTTQTPADEVTTGQETPTNDDSQANSTNPEGTGEQPEGLDEWKAHARQWESRSKANKTALDEAEAQIATLTAERDEVDQAKTTLETETTDLRTKIADFEARDALAELVKTVSADTGVPADALRGETEDELRSHAQTLKSAFPSAPVVPGQADTPSEPPSDAMRELARGVFGRK